MEIVFWSGRDNEEDLVLLSDDVPVETSPITRWVIDLGSVQIDSDQDVGAFAWPVTVIYRGHDAPGVRITLGHLGLAPMQTRGKLILFDPDHPNGLVWGPIRVTIDPID